MLYTVITVTFQNDKTQPLFIHTKHFIAFPEGCESYKGPHSIDCQASLWNSAGCLQGGEGYPSRFLENEEDVLQTLT